MSENKFLLHKMFEQEHKVTLSDEEIARRCGICLSLVQEYIEKDIKAGMFFRGRADSTYHLTLLGLDAWCKKRTTS